MHCADTFQRLVRYESNGQISYGELTDSEKNGFEVVRLDGDLEKGFTSTDEQVTVQKLLCPLEKTPYIICVGLNYKAHAKEASLQVPTYPVLFTKPADALAGPRDAIPIHADAQPMLDYEGELCVIIGRDAKNVTEANALDYVLGYCAGNDVSARNFQLPEASGGQYCYAKSFDSFAPIGPAIWSTKLIPDPQALNYRTLVNGEVVQETGTSDMIWSVKQIIAHLSRGTTIRKGTVIMMGTPSGVGYFRKKFLQNGDVVTVDFQGVGKIENTMVFEA